MGDDVQRIKDELTTAIFHNNSGSYPSNTGFDDNRGEVEHRKTELLNALSELPIQICNDAVTPEKFAEGVGNMVQEIGFIDDLLQTVEFETANDPAEPNYGISDRDQTW